MESRFQIGQTVYMNRGEKMRTMVVAKVIDNPLIPIYQYSFEAPHNGFACGEQSIRETENGRDLKINECFKNDKRDTIKINTIASALREVVDFKEHGLGDTFSDVQVDFKPDLKLAKWLVEYANGRLIIHVGSGQGHLVRMLRMHTPRAIGIEPNLDKEWWLKWRMTRDGANTDVNEILDGDVQRHANLIKSLGEKALLVITRPKVKDFVSETLSIMNEGMEMVYITLDELPFVMNDPYLLEYSKDAKILDHEGVSEDDDLIYSIVK